MSFVKLQMLNACAKNILQRYSNKCIEYMLLSIKMFVARKYVFNVFVANYDKRLSSLLQLYPINCKYSYGK